MEVETEEKIGFITDEIQDDFLNPEIRTKILGFRPQAQILANKYLPYADKIDNESNEMLKSIKNELARVVCERDMNPGIGYLASKILVYIKLYGLKFSKEDHIKLVKLFFELISVPNLEPSKLNKFCLVIGSLLRKTHWLSPDDLQIEWLPLYNLSKIILDKNCSKGDLLRYYPRSGPQICEMSAFMQIANMYGYNMYQDLETETPRDEMADFKLLAKLLGYFDTYHQVEYEAQTLEANLQYVIQQSVYYFPKTATQEILNELFPRLEPLDLGKASTIFEQLSHFLNPVEGHELWFDDFMSMWNVYHNPPWNADMMNIIAIMSTQTIGQINWEPHIPVMFARILRSLELPVCYKGIKSQRMPTMWSSSAALWIVSTLGPNSSTQSYLTKLLVAIESYLHSANSGKWVISIGEVLIRLPKYFIDRLEKERYRKVCWKKPIPDECKLTEDCITKFVESMKSIAFQCMYSRLGPQDFGKIFKHLADLRPEIILPGIIERVYGTMESLTEPHKMTAALQCLISVSRAMVTGHNGFIEAKTHVIPILQLCLTGIDPNDFKKTSVILQVMTSFALYIPIVDCSKASLFYDDLSEEELLICSQTAGFEDFILEFLDKVFILIESSASEQIRMEQSELDNVRSRLESISEILVQAAAHGILQQCSKEILQSAGKKIIEFIKTRLFEPRVAGQLVGVLVRIMSRIYAKEFLKNIVPYLTETIQNLIDENDDIKDLDKQSDELLYYLILLMNTLRGDSNEFICYIDYYIPIIDKVLKFKCKLANKTGCGMIVNLMNTLSSLWTLDSRTCPESYTKELKDFLPIRNWGERLKNNSKINWFQPDEKCVEIARRVIHRYLPPILDSFEKYSNNEIDMSRDEILGDIDVIASLLRCSSFLPNWDTEPIHELTEKRYIQINVYLGFDDDKVVKMPNGENVRLAITKTLSKLQAKMLLECEDDVKSFKAILAVWDRVHMRKHYHPSFETQKKSLMITKAFQEYSLVKYKKSIRAIMVQRVSMQQDLRDELSQPHFTEAHKSIMFDIFRLATSQYSIVRALAQSKLFNMFSTYAFAYRCILDELTTYLALDPNTDHERFKGALYILIGQRRTKLIVRNDWRVVEKLWLSLLKSNLSEKPSVVKLVDRISCSIDEEFLTLTIEMEIPDRCIELAKDLLTDKKSITNKEIEDGKKKLIQQSELNVKRYFRIIETILEIAQRSSIHWRYHLIASTMIYNLVHPATKYPTAVAQYFVHNLNHDLINERKMAIRVINLIMKQVKKEHLKIQVDPFTIGGAAEENRDQKLIPGIRADNRWLQYEIENLPKSQEDWDKPNYIYKCNGYFGWTKDFSVYAPSDKQPDLEQTIEQMTEIERVFFTFFSDKVNVDKLVEFWSLEEKKGKDKFNRTKFYLITSLCRLFGDRLIDNFISHLPRLIEAKSIESNHKCAAEILAGLLRGPKHWPYEKTEKLYLKLQPIVRLALNNITVDTDGYWGTCFATATEHMDPYRQHWLHEVLLEDPLQETTSFIDCSRIYCLQGAFNQHVWRMNSVAHRLLNYLRPYLDHPFQNVRQRLGSMLINIFEGDIEFPNGNPPEGPRVRDIINEILPKIAILLEEKPDKDLLKEVEDSEIVDCEYDKAVRLFKTISQWIVGVINRTTNGNHKEYFELLPFACRLDRTEIDSELAEISVSLLAMISQALTLPDCMGFALEKISEISKMNSWNARFAVLDVLQVLIFQNMPVVLSKEEWIKQVQEIVLLLLEDSVLEVREKSAEVLGGLIHCSFLPTTETLLELFKKKCKTKIVKRRMEMGTCAAEAFSLIENRDANAVRARHTGVLGLCAFISAYPYDIPDFVPEVFEHLGAHLNDPQPIPTTIRKTMGDFKRTHHDNWAIHQLKFTEDQLAVLSDLSVPPSYYA